MWRNEQGWAKLKQGKEWSEAGCVCVGGVWGCGGVCVGVCVWVCVCVRRLGGREQGRTQYPISLVTRCHRTKEAGGPHHGKAVYHPGAISEHFQRELLLNVRPRGASHSLVNPLTHTEQ